MAIWLGLRWLLGLYPGYGLEPTEELRRQTHAVMSTLAITAIFAVSFHIGDLLSRLLLVSGFLGLALMAPLARHCVKRAMIRAGSWGKPVVVLSSGEAGARLVRLLKKEQGLGLGPVAIFDSRTAPVEGALGGVPYGGTVTDAMSGHAAGDRALVTMGRASRRA